MNENWIEENWQRIKQKGVENSFYFALWLTRFDF